uniref:Hemagglutinin-neuraminidase n=1 Tax=Tiger orthorubulavirus TaxID=3028512 RepID=A0AAT9TTX7_9MONO|nr:MAG: hemagglutinin-neuraminidase [Tiger orthorubulavirus]
MVAEDAPVRGTCRVLFRTTTLIFLCTLLALSISILYGSLITQKQIMSQAGSTGSNSRLGSITDLLNNILSVANQIIYNSAVALPLQLDTLESTLLTAIKSLQTSDKLEQNCSWSAALINDNRYINGINQFYFSIAEGRNLTLGPLLNIPSFIPTATTPGGCTRIPSFSLTKTHWCYTHNVILNGCQDHVSSNQFVSMGIIEPTSAGFPSFRTLKTLYLSDGVNRKSCSISTVPGGCMMYCFVSTQPERDNYFSTAPPEQRIIIMYYNDTIVERIINPSGVLDVWATLNPGTGSGVYYLGWVLFPIYGGVIKDTSLWNNQANKYFIPQMVAALCSQNQATQVQNAKSSYYSSWFGNRMIQSGILACPLQQDLTNECLVLPFSNDQVLMGAEGRLYMYGDSVYYYQRSNSWWPMTMLYKVTITFTNGQPSAISAQNVPTQQVPRPGTGDCSATNRCPGFCLTGVYADAWLLTNPSSTSTFGSEATFTGSYLNSATQRINPTMYIANNTQIISSQQFGSSGQKAAYGHTTCFRDTGSVMVYCIYIIELSSSLLGQFQIVPFIRQVTLS